MTAPVYQVSSQLRIHNTQDDWSFDFTADEYETVTVALEVKHGGLSRITNIHIPKDCIQHFIDALEQFK